MWVYSLPDSDRPVAGGVRIEPLSDDPDILVAVTDCNGKQVQVTIDETISCYTWNEFEDLMDDTEAITRQQLQAALGWSAVAFTLEQAEYSLQIFPLIDEDNLPNPGTAYYEACDAWSDWPDTAPPVNPGSILLTWYDDLADGEIGPSDSFQLEFNHCWKDAEDDDIDSLSNGIINFVGYVEEVENGIITRIGFETPAVGSGKIAGVAYGDGDNLEILPLVISETIEVDGQILVDNTLTLSGRYLIVFSEPTL
jgi:hypothetical protein